MRNQHFLTHIFSNFDRVAQGLIGQSIAAVPKCCAMMRQPMSASANLEVALVVIFEIFESKTSCRQQAMSLPFSFASSNYMSFWAFKTRLHLSIFWSFCTGCTSSVRRSEIEKSESTAQQLGLAAAAASAVSLLAYRGLEINCFLLKFKKTFKKKKKLSYEALQALPFCPSPPQRGGAKWQSSVRVLAL